MTRGRRMGVVVVAVAAAIIAFALARPNGGDEDGGSAAPTTVEATTSATGTNTETDAESEPAETESETEPAETESEPAETAPETAETATPQAPTPRPVLVRVEGGEPVGGVRELRVEKGEVVRLVVRADAPEEVHVHGYDIIKEVAPGTPARFRFRATIEGIFEVELEGVGEQIVELRVEP